MLSLQLLGSLVSTPRRPNWPGKIYFITCTVCGSELEEGKRLRTSIALSEEYDQFTH
jgi:hypothetical protein